MKICTREPWIRDAILFRSERIRGDRSIDFSLIAKLRSKCNERHFSDLDVEVPESPDPMDEMNVTNISGEKPGRRRRKIKADHYVFRPHIHRVKMPDSPPGALDSVVEREVRVYDGQFNILWVHEEDIDWLLRYMFVQQHANVALDEGGRRPTKPRMKKSGHGTAKRLHRMRRQGGPQWPC